jgi:hypothetical protein
MNSNQKMTPKYWVAHDTRTDDVFINTASKSLVVCRNLMLIEGCEEYIDYILVALVHVDI